MLLSDIDILHRLLDENPDRRLIVTPIINFAKQLQPSSLDVRLGFGAITFRTLRQLGIDLFMKEDDARAIVEEYSEKMNLSVDDYLILHPGEFVLGTTLEYLCLPSDLCARLEGKSSWGRIGLEVHSTAGFIDPGFSGRLTYEMKNVGPLPVKLRPGIILAQLCFQQLSCASVHRYGYASGGKYQCQYDVMPSRFWKDSEIRKFANINRAKSKC